MEIQNIENHDLKYIYHHLKINSTVIVKPDKSTSKVFFKGFYLGWIDIKLDPENFYPAKVTVIEKEKYKLPTSIEIELQIF